LESDSYAKILLFLRNREVWNPFRKVILSENCQILKIWQFFKSTQKLATRIKAYAFTDRNVCAT